MSTEIGHIKLRGNQKTLNITRLYGGNNRGVCVQLTDNTTGYYIQLSSSDYLSLRKVLDKYLYKYDDLKPIRGSEFIKSDEI